MSIEIASSTKGLPDAVVELRQGCQTPRPRVGVYFASSRYNAADLSRLMQQTFPDSILMGCTTAGELCGDKMLMGSVVAMFLSGDVAEDAACVVVDLAEKAQLAEALHDLALHFRKPISSLDVRKHVGVLLIDGLSGAEERLMETLGGLTDLFIVGGAAGDDMALRSTQVMTLGQAYAHAAVLLVMKLPDGFDILKTQSFQVTEKVLVANQVDEAHRKVIQFNHRPALDAYAAAINVAPEVAATRFMHHPLALIIQGEPYVRSPQRVEDRSISFFCQIKEGMELRVLNATDIVEDTRAALACKKRDLGRIRGLLNFNCILRTLQLRAENRCDEYGSLFSEIPSVGFSTYGEEYLGHINQTSTMLLFR